MAQDKSLKLSVKIDTSDFDRMAKELQGKLANIYGPAQAIQSQNQIGSRMQAQGMGDQNTPGAQAFQRATQNHQRELNALIKQQNDNLKESATYLSKHSSTLAEMLKTQAGMHKGGADELAMRQKIGQSLENERQLQKGLLKDTADMNALLDKQRSGMSPMEQIKAGYQGGAAGGGGMGGGIRGAMGAGDKMLEPIGGLRGGIGLAITAAIQAVKTGSDVYKYFGQAPINASSAQGSAMSMTAGREVSGIYGNRQAYEMAFMPEKARASQMAMEATRRTQNMQGVDAATDIAGGALSTGFKGMVGGALLGGPMGALVGGVGGLALGGASGFAANKSVVMSPFSETANKDRQAGLAKTYAENYTKALQGEMDQNPLKVAAAEDYQSNNGNYLAAQRGGGLDDKSFHGVGGFKDQITNLGFSNQHGMEMIGSILAGGGSSQSAVKNSGLGLQMQRGYNLTNSGSILGSLSSSLGDPSKTENATIKILAQGMKLGLDESKFSEENRRFTQAAAEIISRSGASSGTDTDRVASGFSRFVGENTNKGIDAAKSAYDQYQGMSKETSGVRGVMRQSGIQSDPDLNKANVLSKQALLQIPEEELNKDNPIVQDVARQAKISPEDVVGKVKGINSKSVSSYKDFDDKVAVVKNYLTANKKTKYDASDPSMPQAIKDAYNGAYSINSTQEGYSGQKQNSAFMTGIVSPDGFGGGDTQKVYDKLENGDTGKSGDITEQGMAESSKLVNDNFREFKDTLVPAAKEIAIFNTNLVEMIKVLKTLPNSGEIFRGLNDARYNKAAPKNQEQSRNGKVFE